MSGARVLLDANVLFPTVLREILMDTAAAGGFTPLWSPRILEEWARATRRLPEGAETIARGEIALLRANWPASEITPPEDLSAYDLPDADDRHVLAAAVAGNAAELLTWNRADFPPRRLARYDVVLREPDGFLLELHHGGLDIAGIVEGVQDRAERASGRPQPLRALLKRARLPRLSKALAAGAV